MVRVACLAACMLLPMAAAFTAGLQACTIVRAGVHPPASTGAWRRRMGVGRLRGGGALACSAGAATHPAVQGWPEKYAGKADGETGPRVLHTEFTVEKASDAAVAALDVQNWPTWTTAGNPKWLVGKTNEDKEMPYGELSYVISGKLEIIPPSGERVIVQAGDFVTFPQGFVSTWTVLEELTWHYYLY